jgi:TATA-box binding protein (TBP) (component of TFIID and TFIIIB)
MPKVEASIRIENVVASATLNQRINLNAVVKGNPGVEYRPEQFPGLVFRLKRPKTATLMHACMKLNVPYMNLLSKHVKILESLLTFLQIPYFNVISIFFQKCIKSRFVRSGLSSFLRAF